MQLSDLPEDLRPQTPQEHAVWRWLHAADPAKLQRLILWSGLALEQLDHTMRLQVSFGKST